MGSHQVRFQKSAACAEDGNKERLESKNKQLNRDI